MNREFSICCLVTNRITCQDPQIIYKTLLALQFDIDHFFATFLNSEVLSEITFHAFAKSSIPYISINFKVLNSNPRARVIWTSI